MKIQKINNKEVFICDSHNQVIEFWARHKKSKPNVLSFDHHTDTYIAFQNKWGKEHLKNNDELIKRLSNGEFELINELKHTEHIDAAIRCNFIDKALLLTCDTFGKSNIKGDVMSTEYLINVNDYRDRGNYNGNTRIIVNSHDMEPEMSIKTSLLKEKLEQFKLCIKPSEWKNNYILDIDLDFFYRRTSIKVEDDTCFKEIIKNAKAISIAREERCVNAWKTKYDSTLSVDFLEKKLLEIIKESN